MIQGSVPLDVLVVYSAGYALSALVDDAQSQHPFLLDSKQANYNLSYSYLLESCQKLGITAGLASSLDISSAGTCDAYWTSLAGVWKKNRRSASSRQIFDKISPTSSQRKSERDLLFSQPQVRPFNNANLFDTFFDKLLTHADMPKFAIPTIEITSSSQKNIAMALSQLRTLVKKHRNTLDFSSAIVLKDRYGCGGNHVYKITRNAPKKIHEILVKNPTVSFIIQPFLLFDAGFSYKKNQVATDIRLIFQNNELLQCYIRMAKKDDFRCNEHQGAQLVYVNPSNIPMNVRRAAKQMVTSLNHSHSLYALDLVVSNSGQVHFLEGNTGPGIDWDVTKKKNEKMSKQLIRSIAKELAFRVTHAQPALRKIVRLPASQLLAVKNVLS